MKPDIWPPNFTIQFKYHYNSVSHVVSPVWRDEWAAVWLRTMTRWSSLGKWQVRPIEASPPNWNKEGRSYSGGHGSTTGSFVGGETPIGPTYRWSNLVSVSSYMAKPYTHYTTRAIPPCENGSYCKLVGGRQMYGFIVWDVGWTFEQILGYYMDFFLSINHRIYILFGMLQYTWLWCRFNLYRSTAMRTGVE